MTDMNTSPVSAQELAEMRAVLAKARAAEGTAVLDATRSFLNRFCAFPGAAELNAVTLWAAHTHMIGEFHTTPRLALLSPEPASGKTRVLEVLDLLVSEPMLSLSASAAAVFRSLADRQITLLFDEVDTIWRSRGKEDANEDLRALINAGYRRGATIPRCVGPKHEVQHFPVHCASALAGLGDLPDTVMTRSVIVRMRRRSPGESLEPFRLREHEPQGHTLRDRLAAWAEGVAAEAGASWPEMPSGIVDRPAEIWEPLLAVADAAGGHWPVTAREACVQLCRVAEDRRLSLGVRLLGDLRTIFRDADALHTETILQRLCAGEAHGLDADAPWSELHGKPLGNRGLASMLKKYGVSSQKVTISGRSLQGYRREHLWDVWQRYLPLPRSGKAELAELPESVPEMLVGVGNARGSGSAESRVNTGEIPEVPQIPDNRKGECDSASRIRMAASAAGIDPELLEVNLTADDLDDPGLDLTRYAAGLAREVSP